MTGISEFIVYLWLAPVTLFVILPLVLFLIGSLARVVSSLFGGSPIRNGESLSKIPVTY